MTERDISASETPLSAAVYWFNKRGADELTAADEVKFEDWLARAPENYRTYQSLERQWLTMGRVAEDPRILELRKQDRENFHEPFRWRRFAAIAAILLIVIMSGWGAKNSGLLDGFVGHSDQSKQIARNEVGQRRVLTLQDGSVVTLDTSSELHILDMGKIRSLRLVKGRAFFDVAKDPSRPFIVQAGDKTVEAIGTSFSVRMDENQVIVALLAGKVNVEQKGLVARLTRRVDLDVGQQLVASNESQWKIGKIDVSRETSWMTGRLVFLNDSLAQAIEEMNRYSERKLSFEGDIVPEQRIVGVFETGDLDAFVKAIELNRFGKVISKSDKHIVLAPTDKKRISE